MADSKENGGTGRWLQGRFWQRDPGAHREKETPDGWLRVVLWPCVVKRTAHRTPATPHNEHVGVMLESDKGDACLLAVPH